jgi:hypothetical protein
MKIKQHTSKLPKKKTKYFEMNENAHHTKTDKKCSA